MSQDGGFSFTDISNATSFGVLDSVVAARCAGAVAANLCSDQPER